MSPQSIQRWQRPSSATQQVAEVKLNIHQGTGGGRGRPLPPRRLQRSTSETNMGIGGGRGRPLPPRTWQRSTSVTTKNLAVAEVDLCHPGGGKGQAQYSPRAWRWQRSMAEVDICHPESGRGQFASPQKNLAVAEVGICHPGGGRGQAQYSARGWRWQRSTSATQEVAEVNF